MWRHGVDDDDVFVPITSPVSVSTSDHFFLLATTQ